MDATNTQTWLIVVAVAVLVLIALAAWFFYQKKQSQKLQQRFGPEYKRAIDQLGSRTKAESELKEREKRVERLHIVPLTPPEAARFSQAWKAVQSRFVDNPKNAVVEADKLVDAKARLPRGRFRTSCSRYFGRSPQRRGKLPGGPGYRDAGRARRRRHRGTTQSGGALPRPLR